MQIGGPAEYFVTVTSEAELKTALAFARDSQLLVFVLGGGSNIVFPDAGLKGLVVYMQIKGIEISGSPVPSTSKPEERGIGVSPMSSQAKPEMRGTGVSPMSSPTAQPENPSASSQSNVYVTVGAGEDWDVFVARMVAQNLAGIECLSGIPGSCGATPIQNVGAYGQEVADTIIRVHTIDRDTLEHRSFATDECEFAYRMSRFKGREKDRYVVTSVEFCLKCDGRPTLRYGELSRYVEEYHGSNPTLQQVRDAVLTIRRRKAMVVDSAEPNSRSCGSFFTNPIIPASELPRVIQKGAAAGAIKADEELPAFPCGNDHVKISAAWLIEHSGIRKGMRHGNAGISEKHVLALINSGEATQREILELKDLVQEKVQSTFGISLEPEPIILVG